MVAYHPQGNTIHAYSVHTGQLLSTLQAHFDRVNCCIFHPTREELYSGSNDYQILVWTPYFDEKQDEEEEDNNNNVDNNNNNKVKSKQKKGNVSSDEDNWSDDEDYSNSTATNR